MTGRGRPPLPGEERRDHVVRVRLTAEERAELDALLASKDMTLSEWARLRLREDAVEERVSALEAEVARLRAALETLVQAAGQAAS